MPHTEYVPATMTTKDAGCDLLMDGSVTRPGGLPMAPPAYRRIADGLRSRILAGELPPGTRLPSIRQLARDHAVSDRTTRAVMAVLVADGLVEARPQSGYYVRNQRLIIRDVAARYRHGTAITSPFAADVIAAGGEPRWEHQSTREVAPPNVAVRLGIEPDDPVMRTTYRYLADDEPIQLATSWEPLALTRGTDVELPEDGEVVVVIARMDHIGVQIDRVIEAVQERSASDEEIEALGLPARGAHVVTIERTYYAGDAAVETCDIVLPSGRYQLVYQLRVE
jgi:DNA-binding GntR family transcriptional regulator